MQAGCEKFTIFLPLSLNLGNDKDRAIAAVTYANMRYRIVPLSMILHDPNLDFNGTSLNISKTIQDRDTLKMEY